MNTKFLSPSARKVAVTVTLITLSAVHSQSAVEAWVQRYSHPAGTSAYARQVVTDQAGNVIVAGYTDGYANGQFTASDFLVAKYSGAGIPLWTNRHSGPGNSFDQAYAVAVDGSGNAFVTGSSGTIAYSGAGVLLWTNSGSGSAIAADGNGNVFVTGPSATFAYSGAGVPLWTNSGAGSAIAVDGNGYVFVTGSSATIAYSDAGVPKWTNSDSGTAIAVDGNGNVFVTGTLSIGSAMDIATVAYSGAGVPLWTNIYDGPVNGTDQANAIAVDGSGNVFVTGTSDVAIFNSDYVTVAYSGAGVPLWTNFYNGPFNYSDQARAIAVDSLGNVFVTGDSVGDEFNTDYATIAYSGAGVPLWTNRYSITMNGNDIAYAVAVGSSGNVFVTGESRGASGYDFATIAYSGAGTPLWTNRCRGPGGNGNDQPAAVAVDGSGNVFVTGSSFDGRSRTDYATVAYSSAGVPLWINRYNGPGNGEDIAAAMAVGRNGNVFVTGSSEGAYATVAYSGMGVPLWTNRCGGTVDAFGDARAIAVDGSSNVFVAGRLFSAESSYDFATVAYSGAGAPLWTNRYNSPSNDADVPSAIAVDSSGNVFVTGSSSVGFEDAEYATVAYSGAGVPLWTNRYNGPVNEPDIAQAIAVDGNGNVFVTGRSYGLDTDTDYATVAYSGAGVPLWTNRYSGSADSEAGETANAIAVDGSGNVFVTGRSASDYATVAYSGVGVPLWTNRYGGPGEFGGQARAIAVDSSGNVFVTGISYADEYNGDYATIAYSGAGVPLWTNRYDGPAHKLDRPLTKSCLAVGPDGAVVVTGASDGLLADEGSVDDYATIKYVSSTLSPIRLNAQIVGNQLVLSWTNAAFKLQSAPAVQGTYTDVPGATSPHSTPLSGLQRFFRLKAD